MKTTEWLIAKMKELNALIPEAEGCVNLVLFADDSWQINWEMWGITCSTASSLNEYFEIDTQQIKDNNPEWLPELRRVNRELNACFQK